MLVQEIQVSIKCAIGAIKIYQDRSAGVLHIRSSGENEFVVAEQSYAVKSFETPRFFNPVLIYSAL